MTDLYAYRHITPQAVQKFIRAFALAQKAVSLSPLDNKTHKSLGFVYSAQQEFDLALAISFRAFDLNEDAWDSLISIGDVLEITGKDAEAIKYYQQAFEAITRVYAQQTARVKPWQAGLRAIIGDKHLALEQSEEAGIWYRRVLSFAAFNLRATRGLSGILRRSGNTEDANELCTEFFERIVTPI